MSDPERTVFVIDDDPQEQTILPIQTRAAKSAVQFVFAATERELRAQLPAVRPDLVICDSRFPPFRDYRALPPLIRGLGYRGPIVVFSETIAPAWFDDWRRHDVAEVLEKQALVGAALDRLLAAHVRGPAAAGPGDGRAAP